MCVAFVSTKSHLDFFFAIAGLLAFSVVMFFGNPRFFDPIRVATLFVLFAFGRPASQPPASQPASRKAEARNQLLTRHL